ncbi:hypothetical protein VTO73DRAFT_10284 [Trametes versicolor]
MPLSQTLERRADLAAASIVPFPIRPPPLDSTFGAILIGTFAGLILLGVILHQAYYYTRTFPGDSLWLKSLVALTVSIEIFSSGINMHMCYYYLVTNYFHPETLVRGVWSMDIFSFIGGITPIVTQRNDYCEDHCFYLLPSTFALAVVANLFLTTSLIHALRHKRTSFKSTNVMLDVLILYSLQTGLLNGMFDLVTTILAFAFPQKIIYALSGIPACKIYGITLLVILHSRRTIREKGVSTAVQNFTASDVVFGVDVLPPQETLPVARGDTRPPSQISRMHTRHWLQYGSVMGDGPNAMELKAYGSSPLPVRGIQA